MRSARRWLLVDKLRGEWKVSTRRACSVLNIEGLRYVYNARRGGQAELKRRIEDICETRVRYDYRRVHVLLSREKWMIDSHRIYRLKAM